MIGVDAHDDDLGSDAMQAFAREHPNLVRLGRAGWVAKGVVYSLTGAIALSVVSQSIGIGGGAGQQTEASQSGAVAAIADQPAGAALLIAIAFGLSLYVTWRIVTILLPADHDLHSWAKRAGYAVSAGTYILLGWSAVSFARNPGTSEGSEDAKVEQVTREVLSNTGGRSLLFVVALVILGAGLYFLHKGATASFESDLAPGDVGPFSHRSLVTMGQAGWIGRGLMMCLIGYFLARSAVKFDPDDAVGLDGALRRVADTGPGTVLIAVVAIGLILYGAFCMLSAPRRLLVGAD